MATLRGRVAALMGAVVIVSTVVLAGGAAFAQTGGYPPPTTLPLCTAGGVNAGNVAVGQTVTFTLCGNFAAGATVSLTVNGTSVDVTKTPVNGAVTVVITAVSNTVLEVNDPVDVAAACGTNTVVATGSGNPGTATGTFDLLCSTTATTVASTATSSSALALTGAHVIELLIIAALLIGLGAVLVAWNRRRRQSF